MRLNWLVLFALAIGSASVQAEDYPSGGIIMGRTDRDFMEYKCKPPTRGELVCSFIQISIRKRKGPEDLEKELAKIQETEANLRKEVAGDKMCPMMGVMLTAIKEGKVPKGTDASIFSDPKMFETAWATKPKRERDDVIKVMSTLAKVCEAPTRENIVAMIRAKHDQDARTCTVMTNTFEQTFTKIGDNWVHNQGPNGDCGLIYVTSFEKSPASGITFWDYKTRKIVTNKKATAFLFECKHFDENEYTYTWRTEDVYKGCDYIKYGF